MWYLWLCLKKEKAQIPWQQTRTSLEQKLAHSPALHQRIHWRTPRRWLGSARGAALSRSSVYAEGVARWIAWEASRE